MSDLVYLISHIVSLAVVLAAFKMGYQSGKKEERLIAPLPDIDLPDEEVEQKAPSHDEIMEDIKRSRTIMAGFDSNN